MNSTLHPSSEGTVLYRAAVLGSPIEHSLSPVLHNAGYEAAGLSGWRYTRQRCVAEDLAELVRNAEPSFRGFSVTMPCKFAALEVADVVTKRAQEIGSANTLTRIDDNRWRADNTDCEGVIAAVNELLGDEAPAPTHAVIVGAGGTARAVMWALRHLGVSEITIVNRTDRSDEYAELASGAELNFVDFEAPLADITSASDLVISTVPAGAIDHLASDLAHAPVFDVIYDPWPTRLAVEAAANGYRTVGGLSMLAGQAYAQFEQFTGVDAPREAMRGALMRQKNA